MPSHISGGERFILKRAGIPPEMLESAMGEIHHGHEMLKDLMRDDHDALHESCKNDQYHKMHKERPEMADYLLEGACMYRIICYMHFKAKGEDEFQRIKQECGA